MKDRRTAGVTLAELVVCIAIIGLLGFMVPILIRLFSSLSYLQQKSLMQKEAKAVLWQMSHEIENAVKVDVPGYSPAINMPPGDCAQFTPYPLGTNNNSIPVEDFECIRIWTYDYQQYQDNDHYEKLAMYKYDKADPTKTFVRIIYEVIQEPDSKPYLIKKILFQDPNRDPEPQIFLKGRIVRGTPNSLPPTFQQYGSAQTFKITLKLKSSYDKSTEPARLFSTVMTMLSLPVDMTWP